MHSMQSMHINWKLIVAFSDAFFVFGQNYGWKKESFCKGKSGITCGITFLHHLSELNIQYHNTKCKFKGNLGATTSNPSATAKTSRSFDRELFQDQNESSYFSIWKTWSHQNDEILTWNFGDFSCFPS